MDNIELQLLSGDPIPLIDYKDIDNPRLIGKVHPFTLKDIKDIEHWSLSEKRTEIIANGHLFW